MDSVSKGFVGTAAVQGAIQPGATALAGATSGLFGIGGRVSQAQTLSTTSALSSGIGAFSAFSAGQSSAAQFEIKAGSQELQAEGIKLNATERSNVLKRQLLSDIGAATASAAARGIDVGSGSPREIVEQSISSVKSDVAKIESGAVIQAAGARTSAARSRASGATARLQGALNAARSVVGFGLSRIL